MVHLPDKQLLEKAADAIFQRIDKGTPLHELSPAEQVVVRIYSAQGVIDNGTLFYFFESDWPGNPPYSTFVEAYRAIGVEEIGECIARVAAEFPFPEPHLNRDAREKYLEKHYADETSALVACDEFAVPTDIVFARLAEYAREQGLIS